MPTLDAVPPAPPLTHPQPIFAPVWVPRDFDLPYRAVTAYRAAELSARGELAWLETYYAWCRSLGANTIRVYGMWAATGYSPRTFRRYYDQLLDAFTHARRAGLWVHYLALRDQTADSPVLLPSSMRVDHILRTADLARAAHNVLFEVERDSAVLFAGLRERRLPSVTWEPEPIGGSATPGQHAVQAAVREESGEGWVLHGGFSSQIDPPPDSDLQNCVPPGPGTRALECAHAVAAIWTAAPAEVSACPFCDGSGVVGDAEGE